MKGTKYNVFENSMILPDVVVRQKGAIQGYIVSSRPTWATGETMSKAWFLGVW